jgi:polysaccharide export outer membrane protein
MSGLKPEGVRGNDPAASTLRVQMSWGGASASASRNSAENLWDKMTSCPTFAADSQDKQQASTAAAVPSADDAHVFELLYENFRRTYRLGPADEIAIRVRLEPDYSIERAKISPDGRVFHPLLGDIVVGGLTAEQLTKKLTQDLRRYIKEPEVSVQLLEAKSAKIGVLGEVARPGIFVMSEPLTVLDAVTMAGGFSRTGSRTNVTLVRQGRNGRYQNLTVDLKKLLAGKADVEENLPLQPGDTVIVHGNFLKKLEYVTTLSGFTQFLTFVALTR